MATRDDVTVDFSLSPRVVEVAAPSTEMTVQDLVDTLRKWEDAFRGMPHPKLIDAAGKEPLGGGVLVGITASLRNAKLSFEARRTPAVVGQVTLASTGAIPGLLTFEDNTADFIAAGIQPGSLVINFTDMSIADVVLVDSATRLTTKTLVNGTDNNFDLADDYQVFNIVQCDVSGGNLVATDENGDAFSSILPTAFTQVVRTASSSATLQEQEDIQYASFNGGVTVDVTSPYSGVNYPVGTPRQPVNNLLDASLIATARGFNTLYVLGNLNLDNTTSLAGFIFAGESPNKTTITIQSNADVQQCEFLEATIDGTLDGGNSVQNCVIENLAFVDGILLQCVINGVVTLSGSADAHLLDCWSGVPGLSTPTIDCGGAGSALTLRNYNGGILLRNKTGPEAVSVDLNSGQVILDDTVDAGQIVLRGVGVWTNAETYAGAATVTNQLISQQAFIDALNSGTLYDGKTFEEIQIILLAMAQGRIRETAPGSKIFEVFAQDNTTVLYTMQKTATERNRL